MNVIVYAIPVFIALMAGEFGIGLALGRNVYRLNDAIGSLTAGILSQISGVFMLALSVGVYVLVYNHFALVSRGVGFLPSRPALAAIAAFAALVLIFIWPGVAPDLKAPVAVYVGVIALMAAQAIGRAAALRTGAAAAVAAGALVFMLSDITIALGKFGHVGWPADQWTLPTYYLAQGLIAFCVLPRRR